MAGYIKLHRQITEWEWWHDKNVFRLFILLLLKANHKEQKWKGVTIKRGQLITSLPKLQQQADLTLQQVRTALDKLKATGEITDQSNNRFRLITLVNYDNYQSQDDKETEKNNRQDNRQITGEQQAGNSQATPNKNDKECKNEKNVINKGAKAGFKKPSISEIKAYCKERNNGIDEHRFFDFYEAKNWYIGKNKMKDWKAAVRTWEKPKQSANNFQGRPTENYDHLAVDLFKEEA